MASVKMRDITSHAGVRISLYHFLFRVQRCIGSLDSEPIFPYPHFLARSRGDAQALPTRIPTNLSLIRFAAIAHDQSAQFWFHNHSALAQRNSHTIHSIFPMR